MQALPHIGQVPVDQALSPPIAAWKRLVGREPRAGACEGLLKARKEGQRTVTTLELTRAEPLTARQRKIQSEWSTKTAPERARLEQWPLDSTYGHHARPCGPSDTYAIRQ